jgi:hypothetical protein
MRSRVKQQLVYKVCRFLISATQANVIDAEFEPLPEVVSERRQVVP